MKGEKVLFALLKPGDLVICGDDEHRASSCWLYGGKEVPFVRGPNTEVRQIAPASNPTLYRDGCGCSDLEHLYRWIPEATSSTITPNLPPMALDIISYFKNLSLSKEDKLLKDLGLEEPTGTPTAKGLELSALLNYQANRDEIIAHAVTLDEEEAK